MIRALAFILALAAASPAMAQEVIAGMSQNRVSITANFDGSEILIFGAVRHDVLPQPEGRLDVIVTVAGPSQPVVVRRKARRLGLWINTAAVEVDAAPIFYAVSTSAPLRESLKDIEDLRHRISVPRAIRSVGAPMTVQDSASFTDALIRIRSETGLFQLNEGTVSFELDTLFSTSIALPANLTEGIYSTRIFLTRDGTVVGQVQTALDVQKVGLERWLYNLATTMPLAYGLLAIFIAVTAGWTASAVFRYLRS